MRNQWFYTILLCGIEPLTDRIALHWHCITFGLQSDLRSAKSGLSRKKRYVML